MSKKIEKIRFNSLPEIARLIKQRCKKHWNDLNVVFCHRINENYYFIFQELKSLPLKSIEANEVNSSLYFRMKWENKLDNTNNIKKETSLIGWDDILSTEEKYALNSRTNKMGLYPKKWHLDNNKTYENRLNFRIENIDKICLYEWGFEIFSNTISIIALMNKNDFPYVVFSNNLNKKIILKNNITGNQFNVASKKEGYDDYFVKKEIQSYWLPKYINDEDEDFNEIMTELVKGNKKHKIQNVGQRNVLDMLDME